MKHGESAMAGESDTVKATINGGRCEARYEHSSNDPTADALLKDSVWSMAATGRAFQSQAGDISNGFSTRGGRRAHSGRLSSFRNSKVRPNNAFLVAIQDYQ